MGLGLYERILLGAIVGTVFGMLASDFISERMVAVTLLLTNL